MNQRATVLKSASVGEILPLDQFNYEDLQIRCENYLESIREQTRQMLIKAQQEVEKIKKQAAEQGRQKGLAQGMLEAEKKNDQLLKKKTEQFVQDRIKTVLPLLQQASKEVAHEKQACLSRWESQAIDLVVAITEKIVHRSLALDTEIIKERIEEVLKLTIGNSQITIRIAEQDLESLDSCRETVIATLAQHADVKLIGDPSLSPGDVLVNTEHGQVDARIETQLNRIAEELLGERPAA